ncbi:MAG: S-layer homology domain-containing protein [Clostridiales bacterium]|jgi:hypothetical protein|nr:S-layer homology domain-containing protein [Clostridiales bacterium]
MRRLAAVAILALAFWLAAGTTAVAGSGYIYGDPSEKPFKLNGGYVENTRGITDAKNKYEETLKGLSDADKEDPDTIDALAVLAELLARKVESVDVDKEITEDSLTKQLENAYVRLEDLKGIAKDYDVEFLRPLIPDAMITTDEDYAEVTIPSGLRGRITIRAAGASLTIDASKVSSDAVFKVGRQTSTASTKSASGKSSSLSVKDVFLRFWGIGVVTLVFAAYLGLLIITKKKQPLGMLAAVLSTVVILNGATIYMYPLDDSKDIAVVDPTDPLEPGTGPITVKLGADTHALLGIIGEPDDIMGFDPGGKVLASKYNWIGEFVVAWVGVDGEFTVGENPVDIPDLSGKSEEIRVAAENLVSRGLMGLDDDGNFNPDDEITRAEFLEAMIGSLGLLDPDAPNKFTDVSKGDRYYDVAVSAKKEGLVTGFEDSTFRGDEPIIKEQMIVIAANCLVRAMQYDPASSSVLSRYADEEILAEWSKAGIALATQCGVMIYRMDGMFAPKEAMTRGDAAIVLNRIFHKIW